MNVRTRPDRARPGAHAVPRGGGPERVLPALVTSAIVLSVASIALLAAAMAFGRPAVAGTPLWSLPVRLSPATFGLLERSGLLAGGLAVAAGIAAVGRGWRPSAMLLVGVGAAVAALFVFLPPAGNDTDILDYAIYGRIMALGHNPYVMTPAQLYNSGDPVGLLAPGGYWLTWPTIYGPVVTVLQWAAAELGRASAARIIFWIKFANGIAFVTTSIGLVRLAGRDPSRRARACLLWAVNPLMLFWLVGGGHLDVLLALAAVLALLVLRSRYGSGAIGGAVAGLVIGIATAAKTPFALAALGMAWAARKSPAVIVAGLSCAAAVVIPSYLYPGAWNPNAVTRRIACTKSCFLPLPAAFSSRPTLFVAVVLLLGLTLAGLFLWRMPSGNPDLPAVRPAAALVLAYLVAFPTPGPWYYALFFSLLALLPASRLDYLVIAMFFLLSEEATTQVVGHTIGHISLLLALGVLVVMCLRRSWGGQPSAVLAAG